MPALDVADAGQGRPVQPAVGVDRRREEGRARVGGERTQRDAAPLGRRAQPRLVGEQSHRRRRGLLGILQHDGVGRDGSGRRGRDGGQALLDRQRGRPLAAAGQEEACERDEDENGEAAHPSEVPAAPGAGLRHA
ncbi:hypothetical protein C5C71_12370 [Rathayibacter sp. AY1C1]|nr:hypothetical protein C5C71_12370 [Rathayibacter sp. AY1C1]